MTPSSTPESELFVVTHPVLALEPAHVAEARRALLAQGRDVDEEAAVRLLWMARCLPAALDLLANARSKLSLAHARFAGADVELRDAPVQQRALLAIAHVVAGGVIVEVVDQRALVLAGDDEVAPCCIVRLALVHDTRVRRVAVHRFTIGRG